MSTSVPARVPTTVRVAGALVTLEGLVAVVVAVVAMIRALEGGHEQPGLNPFGFALWLGILFGGVLAAGIALLRGKRWGRAIAVVAQILLLPVVWSLLTDSHQVALGLLLAAVVLPTLVLLFVPATTSWVAGDYAPDARPDATDD